MPEWSNGTVLKTVVGQPTQGSNPCLSAILTSLCSYLEKLTSIISKSNRIAIVGHLGPDPDSIISVLFLFKMIKKNFPDKFVVPVVKGGALPGLTSLDGAESFDTRDIAEVVADSKIDTLFILDVSNFSRVSDDVEALDKAVSDNSTSIVCIDHHQSETINSEYKLHMIVNASSTVEILFDLLVNKLGYEIYDGAYDEVALGMVTDTMSFTFQPVYDYHKSLNIYSQLLDNGAGVAKMLRNLNIFTETDFKVMTAFFSNYHVKEGYNYMFLDLDSIRSFEIGRNDLKRLTNYLANNYLRATSNSLGFLLYPNGEVSNTYRISFRSYEEYFDVSVFARVLGGGGHAGSAGADVVADSLEEAVKKVEDVIVGNMKAARRD